MLMVAQLFDRVGLKDVRVELNSLGVLAERLQHRAALLEYFTRHADALDADSLRRLQTNPLRILDTKNPALQDLVEGAPQLLSFLGESSLKHFDQVKNLLSACGVPWRINPRLVRGLDYYSHTVFEFITDELGAQGTLCGGGRYDGLFETLGAKPTPAVGWGMGIERVLELIQVQAEALPVPVPHAYAVIPEEAALNLALPTLQALRRAGVSVQMHAGSEAGMGSMKSQFKKADASGARFALVFGADELAQGAVTIKSLRDGSGSQVTRALADVAHWASTLQSTG
jgi:histidyl-tRNA synthetase